MGYCGFTRTRKTKLEIKALNKMQNNWYKAFTNGSSKMFGRQPLK